MNARVSQIINDRVEHETNNRIAEYFNNLEQQQNQVSENEEGANQDGFFDLGAEEMAEEPTVDNDNNNDVESYSDFSAINSVLNIVTKANYVPTQHNSTTINPSQLPAPLYKMVLDSGATDTMSAVKELFESITYFYTDGNPPANTPHVILGDDKTVYPIKGYGCIKYHLCGKIIKQFCY